MIHRAKVIEYTSPEYYEVIATEFMFYPSFKGGIQIDEGFKRHFSELTNGDFLKRILKEDLYTEMCGLAFPRFHRLLNVFDQKFQRLVSGGIIDYHFKNYFELPKPPKKNAGPKVLTFDHLEAGFVIWLVSIIIAMTSFICEWIRTLIEGLLVESIVKAFYKLKVYEP